MKELEDYSWFPPLLRNFQTEFIGFVVATFNSYDVFVQYIKNLRLLPQSMTDLCCGSGEPAISIFEKSKCFNHLSLSDKYPIAPKIQKESSSFDILTKDVLEMEFDKGTCYTMFNAFHHFQDDEKIRIVLKIKNSGSRAFIVEILEPSIFCLLKIIFMTTIGVLLFTPFVRPFSLRRLFFTYLIPINVFTISYDGVVSVFKSHSIKHYNDLFSDLDQTIKVFQLKSGFNNLTVIQIEQGR